jgi:hypothetical protein
MENKTGRGRGGERPVDVENETTRCERIDEPALLKRACIRVAEMKEEKKDATLVQSRDPRQL